MFIDVVGHTLGLSKHATDFGPIDESCPCPTCIDGVSRAVLHHTITLETAAAHSKSRLSSRGNWSR